MANGDITLAIKVSGSTSTAGDVVSTFSESLTTSSVATYVDEFLTIDAVAARTVLTVSATAGGATIPALRGLVIFNMGAVALTVGLIDAGVKSVYMNLPVGGMIALTGATIDADDDSGAVVGTLTNIDSVTLQAASSTCVCRVIAY